VYATADRPTADAPAPVSENVASELESDFIIAVYQGEDVLGGQSVRLSELLAQGKPVVLNMWAGLCPACRAEMPELQAAYDEYGDRVLLVAVDIGPFVGLGSEQDARALLDELEVTFPAGTTSSASVVRDYRVLGTPATYFLTPSGEILQQWTGHLTAVQLGGYIEELLEVSVGS
jgi:thiol-disulfide isomerase/thioredoxin